MQEKIEFEVFGIDRNNINTIKYKFNFKTDSQAIVFCLGFVSENISLVKNKTNRYSVHSNKNVKEVLKPKEIQKSNEVEEQEEEKNAENTQGLGC